MLSLKNQFPFRLGAPSFVFPDDVVPNVRKLADFVDDIEIVLFESDAIAPLPDSRAVAELGKMAADKDLSYTVHLPLDADPGRSDPEERRDSVGKILRAIARMAPLDPRAYVIHFPAPADSGKPGPAAKWRDALSRSAADFRHAGVDPARLCVENLDVPFEPLSGFAAEAGFSVCLDVGHARLYGHALRPLLERRPERIRVVHLHGVENGRAHRSPGALDPESVATLREFLKRPGEEPRVVTLEVFREPLLCEALETIKKWMEA